MQDIRYAIRILLQSKGWTLVAVLSLALGIGANTAIFSVFDALLLKSLPVRNPEELLAFTGNYSHRFFEVVREQRMFRDVLATAGVSEQSVEIDNMLPERTPVSLVSGSYFSVLGVPPVIGRTFTADDDQPSGQRSVAVLSYGYWQRRFARDPSVLGKSIRINGAPITVIGVTAPGFFGEQVGAAADLWLPLMLWPQVVPGRNPLLNPGTAWFGIIGRREPNVSVEKMEAELTVLFRRFLTDIFGPDAPADTRSEIAAATVQLEAANNGMSTLRRQFSQPLQVMFGLVVLMLLISCANVANLLLARGAARKREIGLRLALGVSRSRLIRQLLTENLLLSSFSAVLGLAIGWWGKTLLLNLASTSGAPLPLNAGLDVRVLIFVVTLSIGTAILFGLAPIWQASGFDLVTSLRYGPDSSSDSSRRRFGIGSSLVVVQVALSLVLLMGAGLFLQTLRNLRSVDLGFERDQLIVVDVSPTIAGYRGDRYSVFSRQLLDNLHTVPGVAAVTLAENGAFMGRDSSTNRMRADDFAAGPEGIPRSRFDAVGPDYFTTAGISLLAGRDIRQSDTASSQAVVVINEAMARRFFPGVDPIGRRMLWGAGQSERSLEVIGVTRDVKQQSVRDEAGLRFYVAYFQQPNVELANRQPDQSLRFIVRTPASEEAVMDGLQQAIRSMDPRVPILGIAPLSAIVDRTLVLERMVATLSTVFAVVAVGLASVGLYGLMAFRVARRTSEIGIRIAIGATPGNVVRDVMREALSMAVIGTVIGVVGALASARLITSLLFGLTTGDFPTMYTAMGIMLLVAALAAYLPARRASRLNPLIALRHE
jgi:predicted permease